MLQCDTSQAHDGYDFAVAASMAPSPPAHAPSDNLVRDRLHRQPVALNKAYRLLNHGPTVLVSAAHGGQRNIMAAAWAMPLDFDPPKVAVVLDKSTWTRELLEGAGSFALQVPVRAQLDLTEALGNSSGREIVESRGRTSSPPMGWRLSQARPPMRRCSKAARPGSNAGCCPSPRSSSATTCSLAR